MENSGQSARAELSPLRIGLIIDSVCTSKYVYDLTQWAQSRPNIVVAPIVVSSQSKADLGYSRFVPVLLKFARGAQLFSCLSAVGLRIIEAVERIIIANNERHFDHANKFDIRNLAKEPLCIAGIRTGGVVRFEQTDMQKIKNLNLDLLVD